MIVQIDNDPGHRRRLAQLEIAQFFHHCIKSLLLFVVAAVNQK